MPSLYETTAIVGDVSSSNFTTLYNSSGLSAPNTGGGAVSGNLNVSGNLTVQGASLLQGAVVLGSTLSTPNYTFPLPDGTTDQVLVTDGSGNLYWTDVSSIPGAAYSIEANTATGGANLTLVDSAGGTDSVKFAGGTNITVSRTDGNTITISTVADNIPDGTGKGQMLVWDGTAWTANSTVTYDNTTYRSRFVNNVTGGVTATEFLKQFSGTLADGSQVGNFWGFWDAAGLANSNFVMTHRANSEYDSAGNSIFRIQTDPVGNFAPTSTTVYSQLRVNNDTLSINGNEIVLNLNATGAPTENGVLTVNRGSSTDASLTWEESSDRWNFTNDLFVNGTVSTGGDILYINADDTANDSWLSFKGNNTEYLKWNNTNSRFEFSDQIYNTQTDIPAVFERRVLSSEINVPTEAKSALRLIQRVTDAANNDTLVTGPSLTFARTSGATATTEQVYAQVGTSWDGVNDKVWMFFNGSTDNFNEPTPGVFPGSFSMLVLKTDEAYFKNGSLYIDYATSGSPQIGINTNNPGYTLDVNGEANIRSLLTVQADAITINSDKTDQDVYVNFGRVAPSANAAIRWNATTDSFEWSEDGSTWHDFIDATITNPQQGQFLTYDAASTEWINSSTINFTNNTYRPNFQAKLGVYGRTQSGAMISNNTEAVPYTTGDGASLLMGIDSDSQSLTAIGSISTAYDASGDHQLRLSTSTNGFINDKATSITGGNTLVFPAAHGFSIGDKLIYTSPTQNGLTYDTIYYVIATGFTTTQCQISTTLGGSAVALINGTGLNLWFYNGVNRLITATTTEVDVLAKNIVLNATNTGIPFTGTAGLEIERGTSGANQTFAWDETYTFWRASNDLYADDVVIGGVALATNGNYVYFNNENIAPAGDCFIQVQAGGGAGVNPSIKWNDTTQRWQDTVNGSTYYNLPNQNLDTTSGVSFSNIVLDGRASLETETLTTTSTATVPLTSTGRNVMKSVVYITQGANVHTVETLILKTGATTAMLTTYGEMYNTSALATFSADTSGGLIRLLVTPANATSMSFSVVRTSLT